MTEEEAQNFKDSIDHGDTIYAIFKSDWVSGNFRDRFEVTPYALFYTDFETDDVPIPMAKEFNNPNFVSFNKNGIEDHLDLQNELKEMEGYELVWSNDLYDELINGEHNE